MFRILHSIGNYLPVSENWIYPQIVRVPGVEARVICEAFVNLEVFPIEKEALILRRSRWRQGWRLPRFFDAMAQRLRSGTRDMALNDRLAWRPQILHAHFGTRGWESLHFKAQLKVPLVTSFYGYDAWMLPKSAPIWRKRYGELFAQGDLFLVEGPAMSQRLQKLGCPAGKVHLQRLGVDLEALPFEHRGFERGLKVIMVGRFVEKKGMVDGLRACALAASRGVNLNLTIVGDAADNDITGMEIKKELQEMARAPELTGCVNFAGFLPLKKTRALLGSHNVFLCPSRHAVSGDAEGGSPVILTEAMAAGLLCIGTSHCDIPEVILNGKTGYLCREGDSTGMAEILCSQSDNPGRNEEITEAGRKHIEANFSLPLQLDKLRNIYESLVGDS